MSRIISRAAAILPPLAEMRIFQPGVQVCVLIHARKLFVSITCRSYFAAILFIVSFVVFTSPLVAKIFISTIRASGLASLTVSMILQ